MQFHKVYSNENFQSCDLLLNVVNIQQLHSDSKPFETRSMTFLPFWPQVFLSTFFSLILKVRQCSPVEDKVVLPDLRFLKRRSWPCLSFKIFRYEAISLFGLRALAALSVGHLFRLNAYLVIFSVVCIFFFIFFLFIIPVCLFTHLLIDLSFFFLYLYLSSVGFTLGIVQL